MPVHIVQQGECLNVIADTYGFFWETLWNHENNQALKSLRRDPGVLMAGDQVFIPEKRTKEELCQTARRHVFKILGIPCKLNLCLLDNEGRPRSGLHYTLAIDGARKDGVVPADGKVSENISPRARRAELVLKLADGGEEKYALNLAHLNPVEYPSGAQARLKNLGYYHGAITGEMDDDSEQALRKFQAKSGLAVNGQLDAATRAALLQAHGC